jgi:hypothetical protein
MRSIAFATRLVSFVALSVATLLAATALPPPAHASRVRPVNLEQMTARAGRIVQGECTAVEVERDTELQCDVASVTLRVEQTLKGDTAETLTFRMLAGRAELPAFAEGERVILFLYHESRSGLTSPIGLGQGKFTIVTDKQGGKLALNGFGNTTLFNELSPDALTRIGERAEPWAESDGLPPSVLIELVESLAP